MYPLIKEVKIPAPYSYDLRQKVMDVLDSGVSPSIVAARFQIAKRTVYGWKKRRKETGDFRSKKLGNVGYGHKITDWKAFTQFAESHGHMTQADMAEAWDGEISRQTISRALKKIGFTRKKRHMAIKNGMKKGAQNL